MINRYRIWLFFISIIFSTLLINFLIAAGVNVGSLRLDFEALFYASKNMNTLELYIYIGLQRIKQLAIIFIIVKLLSGSVVYSAVCSLFGLFIGILFSVETFYMGFEGVMYSCLCFFPHYIFYFINIKFLSEYYGDVYKKVSILPQNITKLSVFVINSIVFVLGITSEVTLNQIFLNIFFQHLVA